MNVIIIGNKPYNNIDLSCVIDGFDKNYRCNMAMIRNNNGTKQDNLGLCNHLYERLVTDSSYDLEKFTSYYREFYKEEHIKSFFVDFQESKLLYKSVFYANPKTPYYNQFLKNISCPHVFGKQPRTGYVLVMENLLSGNKVSVANFSIYDELRVTDYVREDHYESVCHSAKDELKILRWLHKNEIVDASLCLLEDNSTPTFKCFDLVPNKELLTKMDIEFGSHIIKTGECS